jgi:hypothetical protein
MNSDLAPASSVLSFSGLNGSVCTGVAGRGLKPPPLKPVEYFRYVISVSVQR